MTAEIKRKEDQLKTYLKEKGSVAIAFSSGVDSTYLLSVAKEVLQEKVIAITVCSSLFPGRELSESREFCEKLGVMQYVIQADELSIEGFAKNPPDRCYLCKKDLFTRILDLAREHGIMHVAEGSNMDDLGDYRPGLKAIAELGILSPLRESGLYKAEIRALSKERALNTWAKPSFACLASRFAYGEEITKERLHMVELAEEELLRMGLKQFRVRIHGTLARIEVLPDEFERIMEAGSREQLVTILKKLGFSYVTLDLQGYRVGSMNEVL